MSVRGRVGRRLAATVSGLAIVAAIVLPAGPSAAAGAGYVRLAHLSPDTPNVDVYLRSQSNLIPEKVFPGVGYGALSDYLRLPTGAYAVAMRQAGAKKTDPPVLTTEVAVNDGRAYTVAGVGKYADLGLRVIEDDLSLPPKNAAKVRIIQASVKAPVLDVSVNNGPVVEDNVAFANTTTYRQVAPGTWTLQVKPAGGVQAATLPTTLAAGSVYSLLILDGTSGLKAELHVDAGRRGAVPTGSLATGVGGGGSSTTWLGTVLAAGGAALIAGLVAVVAGRRRRAAAA